MFRSTWKRAVTALVVVLACTLAVPAKASTTAPTMDSAYISAMKLWTKAMEWLTDFWAPAAGSARANHPKFGAGHSSDGHRLSKAGVKTTF